MKAIYNNLSKQKGFSMIELLIVVVIIGIIAAIAIPNLLKARLAANESSAIASTSLIYRSQMTYKTSIGAGEFTDLATLHDRNFIDSVLGATGHTKSGYQFQLDVYPSTAGVEAKFDLRARPTIHTALGLASATGSRDFGENEGGVMYETSDNTPVTFDNNTREAQGSAVQLDR